MLCGLVAVSPSPRFVASQQFAVRCGLLVERGHRGIDFFRDLNDGCETIIYLIQANCGLRSPPDKLTGSFSLVIELLPQPSLFPNFQQLHRRGVQPFQNLRFFAILQGYSTAVEAFFRATRRSFECGWHVKQQRETRSSTTHSSWRCARIYSKILTSRKESLCLGVFGLRRFSPQERESLRIIPVCM